MLLLGVLQAWVYNFACSFETTTGGAVDVAAQLMEHLAEQRRLESRLKELGEKIRQDLDRLDGEEVIIEAEPASWFSTHSDLLSPIWLRGWGHLDSLYGCSCSCPVRMGPGLSILII